MYRPAAAENPTACTWTAHFDPDPATGHDGVSPPQTARDVLIGVLANQGAELAATDTSRTSWEAAEGIPQLSAEYITLARDAQQERWDNLIANSGLTHDQVEAGPLKRRVRTADRRVRQTPKPVVSTPKACSHG